MNFRGIRRFLAPRWLTEGDGGLVGYALDVVKDAFMRRIELGLLARLPQNDPTGLTTAPTDALIAMGRDRRVVRGINETDASYALRLKAWLDDRRKAGSPFELMHQLAGYCGSGGVSFRTVDNSGNWYSRSVTGVETSSLDTGNWDWDGETGRWSRFWVIIYPGTRWADTTVWGDPGDFGDAGRAWGSTITPEQATTLQAIVNDWKPDGTRCLAIILAFDPSSFDPAAPEPDGLWGRWSKVVGGVRVPSRLATARYMSGRSR